MGKGKSNKKIGFSMECTKGITKSVQGDTMDDLIASLEELNDGKFINMFLYNFPNLKENQLKELDRIILGVYDADSIYCYFKKRRQDCNLRKFEDKLIELGNLGVLIDFAVHEIGVDIRKIQEVVIKSRNSSAIARFYREVKGASFEKCKEALFELKDEYSISTLFDKNSINSPEIIDMSDFHKAESIIIQSKNFYAMLHWAKEHNKSDIIQNAIIDSKNIADMIRWAEEYDNNDIIQNAIIDSKNPQSIFLFARDVKGSNKHKLRRAMMKTKDKYWIKEWKACFGLQGILF